MSRRVPCCVPFCRRTYRDDDGSCVEAICGKHFRLADKNLRIKLTKCRRQVRTGKRSLERGRKLDDYLWGKIKKQAIERAAGI